MLTKSVAGLASEKRNPNGQAGTMQSQPFPVQICMPIPGGRRESGFGTHCLSVFSWDCCMEASATACQRSCLVRCRDLWCRGWRLRQHWVGLSGFVALYGHSVQSGLKYRWAIFALCITECEFPTISSHSTEKAAWKMGLFFSFFAMMWFCFAFLIKPNKKS